MHVAHFKSDMNFLTTHLLLQCINYSSCDWKYITYFHDIMKRYACITYFVFHVRKSWFIFTASFISLPILWVVFTDEVESSASGSPIIDVERVSSDDESYYQHTRSKSQSISKSCLKSMTIGNSLLKSMPISKSHAPNSSPSVSCHLILKVHQ